jgi:hypothetical protein
VSLQAKRAVLAGLMDQVNEANAEFRARVRATRFEGISPGGHAAMLRRLDPSLAAGAVLMEQNVRALEALYTSLDDLLRFLNTSAGQPTLNGEGKLDFFTQSALDGFKERAGRVDTALAAIARANEAAEQHQQQSLARMRRALNE